ncbi:hypothetical protein [Pedobacter sp. FW305-3-2-15-E-R2A2]|uniref:hypothetical protein n=1 Tax=Pedobacter sp. FW305-3-2-15-E-R2A2 TaxID=3140251 RepID=UPI003140A78A
MFFQLLIAMILGLTSPSNTTNATQNSATTMDDTKGDPITGGDTGQNPPPKK